jgi:outer membrane protease
MFDLNVGLDLATVRGLVLCGVAGWKRSAWEWKDRGLWYRESEKGFRDKAGSYGGINTAEYEQTFSTLYAGGDARVSPAAGLDLEGYLLLSPLSWSSDSAHYRLRETKTFPDGVHVESGSVFGLYLGAGGRATLHLTEELYAGLSVDLETFPKRTGDQKTLETNEVVEDGTAVSAAATMFSAVLGWRF